MKIHLRLYLRLCATVSLLEINFIRQFTGHFGYLLGSQGGHFDFQFVDFLFEVQELRVLIRCVLRSGRHTKISYISLLVHIDLCR